MGISKFQRYFRKSLARQFAGLLFTFFIFSILGASILLSYQHKLTEEYGQKNIVLENKETIGQRLDQAYNKSFFDMRGYFAFDNPDLKENALNQLNIISNLTYELEKVMSTDEDIIFYNEVQDFTSYYYEQAIPQAVEYYESGNKEALIEFVRYGTTSRVNNFQEILQTYRLSKDQELEDNFEELAKRLTTSQLAFVFYIGMMLIMLLIISRRMVIQIGQPLQSLAIAAMDISEGKDFRKLEQSTRNDELGTLSRAFEKMFQSIQENEQDLTAQNEELIAQQDELNAQRLELEDALLLMGEREETLKRRNQLIRGLSTTLDKQKVLKSIVENMSMLIKADQGIIVLLDTNDYAGFAISSNGAEQFIQHLRNGHATRAVNDKKAFVVERETSISERGYHEHSSNCSDLYVPVVSYDDRVTAIMVYTRYGSGYLEKDIEEYEFLAKQISISLENIKLFDQTEENRLMTQDILNTIHEGVQFVNQEGMIIQINNKMCEMVNCDDDPQSFTQLSFNNWKTILKDVVEDSEGLLNFLNKGVNTESTMEVCSYIYHTKSPSKVIQVYCEPLFRNKQKLGTVFVYRDITSEFEVDQMKSEFVSTVSHELRTPLASVLGFTELLINKELKPERQQKYLSTIYHEAKRLTALINDFLDVQRMESGKQSYEKKYENLVPILESVIENQKVSTAMHSIQMIHNTNHTFVLGDKDKLSQLFGNLLNNAIKYSPNGGVIKFILHELENKFIIDLIDEGLGIPEDAIEKLFTKFYRVDNSDRRKIGGTGLGLSIVKEIVKAHEGEVSVSSTLGVGTTFTIAFPLVKNRNDDERNSIIDMDLQKHANVIIVEDDISLSTLLEAELKDNGFTVQSYKSGMKGVRAIKNSNPDAIVLDIMLEGKEMDGWDVLREIKQDDKTSHIPIFISSALEEKEKGLALGASGYLVKPYRPSKLTKTILQTILKRDKHGQILIPKSMKEEKKM